VIAPPLSLYVHLPWCVRKCPYCDFNSHSAPNGAPRDRYIDALLVDLEVEAQRAGESGARERVIESIFLGGGTPSLFTPDEIGRLLDAAANTLTLAADVEVTMEANPGSVECGAPRGYRTAGVNRLSMGAQSFDDEALQRLGRVHNSDDIRRAFDAAVSGGFDNINLDLMHGLPGQTIGTAEQDIEAAIELAPQHVSWYQLTLEPNTVFHARPPEDLPDEDLAAQIQDAGNALLADAGYEQYEVSAWAQPDRRCRHNVNYWLFGDYLAIGAGAHGKLTAGSDVMRYRKPAHPVQYMQAMASGEYGMSADLLSEPDLVFEFMLNALRLVEGFPDQLFSERTGLAIEVLEDEAAAAVTKGLLERTAERRWRPTGFGQRFLNDLQAEFLR